MKCVDDAKLPAANKVFARLRRDGHRWKISSSVNLRVESEPTDRNQKRQVSQIQHEIQIEKKKVVNRTGRWLDLPVFFFAQLGTGLCEVCANKQLELISPSKLSSAEAGQAVDYKKLIDLDASDVVANADGFDCPVCMMVPTKVGVSLRKCQHNFGRFVNG